MWVGRDSNPLTARPIRQFVIRLDLQSSAVTYPYYLCSISWNRTKFLWIALQRVLCLRRPSFWQKESICNSTQFWMWFPLLFVSNTLICRQVSVYASPSELVKQVYMSMTTSPVLWAKKDLNLRLPRYQRGTLNHLSYLPIKYNSNHIANSEHPWKLYFCGPKGNRTLHDLLAREFRQPWNMRAQNTQS